MVNVVLLLLHTMEALGRAGVVLSIQNLMPFLKVQLHILVSGMGACSNVQARFH